MTPAQTLPSTTAAERVAQQPPAPATPANLRAQESGLERRETPGSGHAPSGTARAGNHRRATRRRAWPAGPRSTHREPSRPPRRRLERQVARPIQVPRTEVDLDRAPSVARRTRPDEIQPQTTNGPAPDDGQSGSPPPDGGTYARSRTDGRPQTAAPSIADAAGNRIGPSPRLRAQPADAGHNAA